MSIVGDYAIDVFSKKRKDMVIDFHIHGKIKKTFPFSIKNFNNYIKEAKNENLTCIAITEHYHSDNFEETYRYLQSNYEYKDNNYFVEGIKVFVGMEVTTSARLDFIFVGDRKDVFDSRTLIHDSIQENKFIEIDRLFEIYDRNNMIVILAHPYRKHDVFPMLSDFVLNKIDAIECNATDLYKQGINFMKEKIYALSKKINKPIVAGSDSHYFLQLGSVKNVFENKTYSILEIKKHIKNRNFKIEISSNLRLRVKSAKIIKKLKAKNNDVE